MEGIYKDKDASTIKATVAIRQPGLVMHTGKVLVYGRWTGLWKINEQIENYLFMQLLSIHYHGIVASL